MADSPSITDRKPPLVPQPHGGAIHQGGVLGHRGGRGRPRDEIRAKLRTIAYEQSLAFLEELFRGEIPVTLIGTCPKCQATAPLDGLVVTDILDRVRTSIDQRLKASEQTFKYGVGLQTQALSAEQVEADAQAMMAAFWTIATQEWGRTPEEARAAGLRIAAAARVDA